MAVRISHSIPGVWVSFAWGTTDLYDLRLAYFNQTTNCDRLNAAADIRAELLSVKSYSRDLQKCKTMLPFSLNFFGGK